MEVEVIIMTKVTRIMKMPHGHTNSQLVAALRKMEEEVEAEIDDAMLDLVDLDNSEDFVKNIKVKLAPS